MLTDFFIQRPIFASVCSLMILLAGLVCIPSLPIAQYPRIAPTEIDVTAQYIGADAKTVENGVNTILETQINGVEGMKYMSSFASNTGNSKISVLFDLDRDEDIAQVDVQNRVQQVLGRLPSQVKNTGVTVKKASTAIVMAVALFSENNTYSDYYLSNYADRYLIDTLKRVPGVSDVAILGERKYAMRLWLDPQRMSFYNMTAGDLVRALQQKNVQVPAGEVGRPPINAEQAYQMSIRVNSRLKNTEEFDNLVLKSLKGGTVIRVRDIGRSELAAEDYSTNLTFLGNPGVGLIIYQQNSANALQVDERVRAKLDELAAQFPPGMKYQVAFNTTEVVRDSIHEVIQTLFEAILLVVLVIFLFLQKFRSTLIPLITIPVSLLGTFTFMAAFGFSINTLTLFGLTLATGLVVDDAIIVIENIDRLMEEEKMSLLEATQKGMREIFSALIATSLVLIAVFVPVAFFPGTTGVLYKQFALTIAVAIGLSAFNALTLAPALYYLFMKGQDPHAPTEEKPKFIVLRWVDAVLEKANRFFHRLTLRAVRLKPMVMLGFVASLGLMVFLLNNLPKGFVPTDDQGYFIITVKGPPGVSLNYTDGIIRQIDGILGKETAILGTFAISGMGFNGNTPNSATVYVTMKPNEERHGAENSVKAVIKRVRPQLMGKITGALAVPIEPPAIQGFGNTGGFAFELKNEGGSSLQDLQTAAQQLISQAGKSPVLDGLFTSYSANDPQWMVDIDREKIDTLNISMDEVFQTLQVYMGSVYVNDFDYLNRVYRVYVQADQHFRKNAHNIDEYYVRSRIGQMIPLGSLLKLSRTHDPSTISHFNLFQSAEITGSPKPGFSMGQAMAAMETLARKTLPNGMTFEWSGLALEQQSAGTATLVLFALGFLFVYLILAAQYESISDPIVIMLAVPLGILGAVLAQHLRGLENDIFCQIGLTMLIGLTAKNAILIVEFANHMRKTGVSIKTAAVHAAKTRFRPIMMTSFAFILGLMPMVTATGAGSAARNSMGNTVVGGMLVSTFIGLIIVPVLYCVVCEGRERLLKKKNRPRVS
jgi:HAE1 family hydrophobic/amphiphilic exporter-1